MTAPEPQHTVAELAKAWRCSKNFIYDLIKAGKLRSVNLGDGRAKTRIPESAVVEYLGKRERAPKGRAA